MLSRPENGWAEIQIGTFKKEVSYLTDVPNDLLKAFISFFENGAGVASFECEPYEFDLVFSFTFTGGVKGMAYIMDSEQKLFYEEISVIQLAKEFVSDIKTDLLVWSSWNENTSMKRSDKIKEQKKQDILVGLEKLEKLMRG